jgi:hypothetical protein
LGYRRGLGVPKKSATLSGDHFLLYLTPPEKKKMFLKAFSLLLSFFICLVLEDPVYMYNINRIFKYKIKKKNLKVKKRLFKTFFSFLQVLYIIKNDPLIML